MANAACGGWGHSGQQTTGQEVSRQVSIACRKALAQDTEPHRAAPGWPAFESPQQPAEGKASLDCLGPTGLRQLWAVSGEGTVWSGWQAARPSPLLPGRDEDTPLPSPPSNDPLQTGHGRFSPYYRA